MKSAIAYTKLQKILLLIGLLVLTYLFARLTVLWPSIPQQVPSHFNAIGEVDAWSAKSNLLFIAGMAVVLYGVLVLVIFFPASWNMPVKITEENREVLYRKTRTMLCALSVILVCMFSYMILQSAKIQPLSKWFLPITLITLFGSVAYSIFDLIKENKKLTLENNKRIG